MKKLPSITPLIKDNARPNSASNLPPTIDRRKEQKVSPKQRAFIEHFFGEANRDKTKAAIMAGYPAKTAGSYGQQLCDPTRFPLVANEIKNRMDILDGKAMLDAEGVLRYIHTAMLYRPLEWFRPSKDGGWMIDENALINLPPEIGCLIEEVESKVSVTRTGDDGAETTTSYLKVKLVSKSAMTALAAKYQLTQKVFRELSENIDWDTVIEKAAERRANNPILKRLEQVSREALLKDQIGADEIVDMEGDQNVSE